MRLRAALLLASMTCLFCFSLAADHPECETYAATQPDAMVTNVLLVYSWDPTCGPDPVLGPLERDGDAIELDWEHDTGVDPHEHTAWDHALDPGVHSYDLTVTPDGEDSYVLHDALAVTGTAPTSDAGPDSGSDSDVDSDSDADTDDDGDSGASGSDGGCGVAPRSARWNASLLVALIEAAR